MDKDFLKEKIKLQTEWLRGFYGLFILICSGLATLYVKRIFLTYEIDVKTILNFDIINNLMIAGGILAAIIFVLILIVNKRINRVIKKLNQL